MKKVNAYFNRVMCIPLVDGCKTYTEFYDRNWKFIYTYFRNDLQDEFEAEDVTHDVFEYLWKYLFRLNEDVNTLARVHRDNLTYQVKCAIGGIRANRNRTLNRRIKAQLESQMYDNPNITESPLEAALNKHAAAGDPYIETRVNYFIDDLKKTFDDREVSDLFTYLFFGFSHDETQNLAKITHNNFYKHYKKNRSIYEEIVVKHFDRGELNGVG